MAFLPRCICNIAGIRAFPYLICVGNKICNITIRRRISYTSELLPTFAAGKPGSFCACVLFTTCCHTFAMSASQHRRRAEAHHLEACRRAARASRPPARKPLPKELLRRCRSEWVLYNRGIGFMRPMLPSPYMQAHASFAAAS